jgi:hypothetical protein
MSDFLVQMGNGCSSEHLLALLKLPYGRLAPKGRGFAFPWGSIAVLEDPLGSNQNITASDQGVLAWVGDLVGGMSDSFRTALTARLAALQHSARDCDNDLQNDPVFKQLNGAFAILFADQTGYSIVVDPLGATQVFFGKGHDGQRVSAGTHADLVATAAGISDEMDFVSITQFLRHGYCVFPCTMYKNLVEGQPGAVHAMCRTEDEDLRPRQWSYWSPPPEVRTGYREADLAETAVSPARRSLCATGSIVRLRQHSAPLPHMGGPGFRCSDRKSISRIISLMLSSSLGVSANSCTRICSASRIPSRRKWMSC